MTKATRAFHNRIALVFDFDETLAPSTFPVLLDHLGIDHEEFKRTRIEPLTDAGWEDVLAKGYSLIEESQRRDHPITNDTFRAVADKLQLYDGVSEMFDRITERAQAILPDIAVEFYMLTAGFDEIPKATSIADQFREIWGGAFHTDENGAITFVKRVVTHPEKVRYLLMLSKGLVQEGANEPANVYQDVPDDELHVPLDQMIYVGDGASDMPAFALMNGSGGIAIGVFESDSAAKWDSHDDMSERRRIQNLAPADYSENSELMQSLTLAAESLCKRIALRKLSIGE